MSESRVLPCAIVCLRGALRAKAQGQAEHELPGTSVIALLRELERRHPDLGGWIIDERGRIRRHINVYVGGERADEGTAVRPGDRVEVVPAITGG